MLIEKFTQQETQNLRLLREKHILELKSAKDSKEQAQLRLKFSEELSRFLEQCYKSRFAALENDPDAILADVEKTAGLIIKRNFEELMEHSTAEDLKALDIISIEGDKVYLNTNFITDVLKDDFKLHIDALQDDPERLKQLYSLIIDAIEASEYTERSDIDLTGLDETDIKIMPFRRRPLKDIHYFGLLNDKATTHLLQEGDIFQQEINGQLTVRWAVDQLPEKKKQAATYIALTYEGREVNISRKLSAFDKAVYEAVSTRYYYWKLDNEQKPLYITPHEIWRTMNGKKAGDSKSKPSDAQAQKICNSMDKLRFTRILMDISEEIKAFDLKINDERITSGKIDTYTLNSSKVEFMTDKGNKVEGYKITEEPILYTYNDLKNHLLFVPYHLLDTSSTTSNSENVTEFRNYLLQQIHLMKSGAEEKSSKKFKRSNVILLDTIYESTGVLPPEERIEGKDYKTEASKQKEIRRLRQADRQKIEGILNAWIDKAWIKGYTVLNAKNEPIKERQQAKGFSIDI